MTKYNTDTPILFLIFNRPGTTRQVFAQIRKAQPRRLYIAADGPRSPDEEVICQQVRDIALSVDWECDIQTLFRKENLGCGKAISQAVTWFFENEPEGIILEDDCLPSDSFFGFCSAMLEKYRDDSRVGHISGGNYQKGLIRGDGSYYFSALTHVWGWAGWRRVWKDYDLQMGSLPTFEKLKYLDILPCHSPFKEYWTYFFRLYNSGKTDSWDFSYSYLNLVNSRLSVISNINLITNIGCSQEPTHYIPDHPFADIPSGELDEIIHPSFVVCDITADLHSQHLELKLPVYEPDNTDFLFMKDRLVYLSNKYDGFMKIPKIIHQIYEDPAGPPRMLLKSAETWKKHHPGWEYRFWDRQSIDNFLLEICPGYMETYRSFPFNVQRWDAIRYLILYQFGGLYADMDYGCIEPLDGLLVDSSCCMGLEPQPNAARFNMPHIVGNALMASVPEHPYFKNMIDDIFDHPEPLKEGQSKSRYILDTTGPFMTTRMYDAFPEKETVTLLPAELIAPLTLKEVRQFFSGKENKIIEEKMEKAFAVHYFFGSWTEQTKNKHAVA